MSQHSSLAIRGPFTLGPLATSLLLCFAASSHAAPQGGTVAAGSASIANAGSVTTITQTSANAVLNWQSFSIGAGEAVQFRQPGAGSVALNRVLGANPSAILGSLSANGQVFLVNPNGILFGQGASVNVGGLVASTLNITDADFMAGRLRFNGSSRAGVHNEGSIHADGGYVALVGANVANRGMISSRLGSVALAAGQAVTLDVLGGGLLNAKVDQGAVNALVENGGLIQADGGQVLMTAQAAGDLLGTVVNNTGVVRAQTIDTRNGTIKLLGDMQGGTVNLSGTLDASAPNGGNGGFIETSATNVRIQNSARATTAAPAGRSGTWLIDPEDFRIGSVAGDNISGTTLSANLMLGDVVITTAAGPGAGAGDIFVNDAVVWDRSGPGMTPTTLTLNALRDVNINREITATKGNLVVCCGRDVNVNAKVTVTNGSVLLSAGNNVNVIRDSGSLALPQKNLTGITVTAGNLMMCAANDVVLDNRFDAASLITLTTGSIVPGENLAALGVPRGLRLAAGLGGTGPGPAGGTVRISANTKITVTGPAGLAPIDIVYNPTSYLTPTDYTPFFATGNGAPFTTRMLVFADGGSRPANGSTATTLSGLKGAPAGVTLVAGPASLANFDNTAVGIDKVISFTGYTLDGVAANNFALPVACCGPIVARTTGAILAAAPPPPPPPAPPPAPAPVPPLPVIVVPVVPVPVPVVITPPPLIVPAPLVTPVAAPTTVVAAPTTVVAAPTSVVETARVVDATDEEMPQFAPFVVAPVLLRTPTTLLVVAPTQRTAQDLVVVQAPAPAPVVVVAPTPAPPPAYVPPVLPPKPFRN